MANKPPKLKRTTMRLDRELKRRLQARADMEGRPAMRLLAMILRDGLKKKARLTFDATGYEPKREITTVRLSVDLMRHLSRRAKIEERSPSNITEIMLHTALIQNKAPHGSVFG
jgi:predicted transcriptional regulator